MVLCSANKRNSLLTFEFNSTYLIELVKIYGRTHPNTYVIPLTIQNNTGLGFELISDNQSGIPKVSQFRYSVIGSHKKFNNSEYIRYSYKFNTWW